MTPSSAEVIPADAGDVASANAADVGSAKTSHVTAAEATDMTSAEAAHVAASKAATTKAATTMSAAAATAAAGLCPGGNKAAGKQYGCQNRHQSSSHDISPLEWADVPPQDLRQLSTCLSKTNADVAMGWRWTFSSTVSSKFAFNHPTLQTRRVQTKGERARDQPPGAQGSAQRRWFPKTKFVFS
jgi:nickel-dependent lactate racemase